VMALGTMVVMLAVLTAIIDYSTSNVHHTTYSRASATAYSLAEAAVNDALGVLIKAADPSNSSAVPTTSETLAVGTAKYSGVLSGTTWTLTGTGSVRSPTGASNVTRLVTRKVYITGLASGGLLDPAWDRIYNDDTSACMNVLSGVTIPSPLSVRGNLCLLGTTTASKITASVIVGGNVTLGSANSSIGVSGTNVPEADIAGTCKFGSNAAHTPCSSADKVFATTIKTTTSGLTKPTTATSYWYQNGAPGPKHPCGENGGASSGTKPVFDGDALYNNSVVDTNTLTPTTGSYVCQVKDTNGNVIGELSWTKNAGNNNGVLKIAGTIFIDGAVSFTSPVGQTIDYQGRGTLYTSDTFKIDGVNICAGGTGTTLCHTSAATMQTWDPTTNMLIVIAGNSTSTVPSSGNDLDWHGNSSGAAGAFQGVGYAVHDCKQEAGMWTSSPLLCNGVDGILGPGPNPGYYTWPALPVAQTGQLYLQGAANDMQLTLGPATG